MTIHPTSLQKRIVIEKKKKSLNDEKENKLLKKRVRKNQAIKKRKLYLKRCQPRRTKCLPVPRMPCSPW